MLPGAESAGTRPKCAQRQLSARRSEAAPSRGARASQGEQHARTQSKGSEDERMRAKESILRSYERLALRAIWRALRWCDTLMMRGAMRNFVKVHMRPGMHTPLPPKNPSKAPMATAGSSGKRIKVSLFKTG